MTDDRSGPGSGEHLEVQELLPWYVTGALDPAEQARVGAHVAACAECQAEVGHERLLERAVAGLPLAMESGWADMRRRIEADAVEAPAAPRRRQPWIGWAMAASIGVVAGLSAVAIRPTPAAGPQPAYRALSAAPERPAGNVIVIFRPDLTEADLRGVLNANHARLMDGPTAADAYVLHVPPAERTAALARMKADRGVVLAQPIDAAPAP